MNRRGFIGRFVGAALAMLGLGAGAARTKWSGDIMVPMSFGVGDGKSGKCIVAYQQGRWWKLLTMSGGMEEYHGPLFKVETVVAKDEWVVVGEV